MDVYPCERDRQTTEHGRRLQVRGSGEVLRRPEVLVPSHSLDPCALWQGVGVISRKRLYSLDGFGDRAGPLEGQLEVVAVLEGMAVRVDKTLRTVSVEMRLIYVQRGLRTGVRE
jgi:hypothetical protein